MPSRLSYPARIVATAPERGHPGRSMPPELTRQEHSNSLLCKKGAAARMAALRSCGRASFLLIQTQD